MSNLEWAPLAVLGAAFVALAIPRLALFYKRRRHLHLVLCPDTDADALVKLDEKACATPRCAVADCTEWPKKRACSQECAHGLRETR